MNKGEFIDFIAKKQECTKVEAERIINIFTESVTDAFAAGEEITLIGFGKFYTSKMAAREGRNPKTGVPMKIAASILAKFSAGQKLKDACNKKKAKKK